jgi:hypothetical protein
MMSVREAMMSLTTRLPNDCTWEDVFHEIYVWRQIEAGLKDVAAGRVVPHKEVFAKYAKKKKTASAMVRNGRKKP